MVHYIIETTGDCCETLFAGRDRQGRQAGRQALLEKHGICQKEQNTNKKNGYRYEQT